MNKLDDPALLDILKRLAEAIVAVFGMNCEVVVHDFRDLEHSVKMVVGNVTGRRPGSPVPDLDFIRDQLDLDAPDQLNYRTRIADRTLQSSTVWIRDESGKPIGAICINFDYSDLLQIYNLTEQLISPTHIPSSVVENTFAKDLDELVEQSISDFCREQGFSSIESISRDEKLKLIQVLEDRGLFKIRGTTNRVAELLNISRASLYNYRAELNNEN